MNRGAQSGFSLVELAVVLVVIGLILGAVSLTSGVQRSAEHSSLFARYILPWSDAYTEYFNRNGFVLGDSLPASGQVNRGAGNLCGATMKTTFTTAGLELPGGRGRGSEELYLYIDADGNQQQLSVCFDYVSDWFTASGAEPANIMRITGATLDLARKIDSMIDVNADSGWGDLRSSANYDSNVSVVWPALRDSDGDIQTVELYYRMPY